MSYSHFTLATRRRLEHFHSLGRSLSECARLLGMHRSTVKRELARNSNGKYYSAEYAHYWAMKRKERPEGNRSPRRTLVKPVWSRISDPFSKQAKRIFIGEDNSLRLSRHRRYFYEGEKLFRKPLTAYQKYCRRSILKKRLRLHDWENQWRAKRDWHTIHMLASFRQKIRDASYCVSYCYRIEFPAVPVLSRTYHGPLNLLRIKTLRPALLGRYNAKSILGEEYRVVEEKMWPHHENRMNDQKIHGEIKKRWYYQINIGTTKNVSGQSQYAGKNLGEYAKNMQKKCRDTISCVSAFFCGARYCRPFFHTTPYASCFFVLPGRFFTSAVFC